MFLLNLVLFANPYSNSSKPRHTYGVSKRRRTPYKLTVYSDIIYTILVLCFQSQLKLEVKSISVVITLRCNLVPDAKFLT